MHVIIHLTKVYRPVLLSKELKINTYKTIILPVILYYCETWSLTFREEHRLRVFENKVLRKIYRTKMKLQKNGGSSIILG